MRKRREPERVFLERTETEWREICPHREPKVFVLLLAFAGSTLASAGRLRDDEIQRLQRIAGGIEGHPRLNADQAVMVLADEKPDAAKRSLQRSETHASA
jgi:hypothetical protein